MKIFILLFLLVTTTWAQNANTEFRATWVITWDWINPDDTSDEIQEKIRVILDNHVDANMTSVLFQVRQSGTAYYNSSYEPWGYYAGYNDPGFDPLTFAVEEAHARGLELHAWFNTFQTSSTYTGTPAAEHPEWICRDQSGNPMNSYRSISPGLVDVRQYLVNVSMEIVNNYDIDGLHLDYVRWNEHSNSSRQINYGEQIDEIYMNDGWITQDQIQEINTNRTGRYLYDVDHPYSGGVPSDFSSWEEWWRWTVTEFVETLHDSMQTVKPHVRLSVAALGNYRWGGWQGYGTVYQDAALWFNEGVIDQLTPMHYHWTTASGFYNMLVGSNGQSNSTQCWGYYIQPGINAGRLYSVGVGSYMLQDNNVWNNHTSIVNTCRSINWIDGFQFFSMGEWDYQDYWIEAGNSFFHRNTKIRHINDNSGIQPPSPLISIDQIDSLSYLIVVQPQDTITNLWSAIYRSEDDSINLNDDDIILIHFGRDTLTYIDSFDGNQDFNGQYTYGVTQFDRYWNESSVSNSVMTDSIPSFPPVVVTTHPMDGDTIHVNEPLEILFSKTMSISTMDTTSLHIFPAMPFSTSWNNQNHTLIINFTSNLDYDTDYELTLDADITDINGVFLDGNGDGIGGDPFTLHFTTVEEDIFGPVIFESNLNFLVSNNDIDIHDIITIVFDEIVENSTLTENSMVLTKLGNSISYTMHISDIHGKTAVTIRPNEPFIPNSNYEFSLSETITDLLENPLAPLNTTFLTSPFGYSEITTIDNFNNVNNWWDPIGSGSTVGVLSGTSFGTSNQIFLPGTSPEKTARLSYVWDLNAPNQFIREYLSGGPPRSIQFDTSYTLQCYIYGDGSNNLFRFCVDDHVPDAAGEYHEVSQWISLDWLGWRLIEWDLGADSLGNWIGNGLLEGLLRIDSFQLTHASDGASEGRIFFDNFQVVNKTTLEKGAELTLPTDFVLHQNYPNPFNPITKISYLLPKTTEINLSIYDILGRHIFQLDKGIKQPGRHEVIWRGKNKFNQYVSSGVYFYILIAGEFVDRKQMIYIK
ncbi:MAG: family 10 glycosylhydrolase [Candidatus Marinimicrobia bacterium]|nr:family 10 glycosylhydrolase [Candidatus Neomarinimicrobiota bacterium]